MEAFDPSIEPDGFFESILSAEDMSKLCLIGLQTQHEQTLKGSGIAGTMYNILKPHERQMIDRNLQDRQIIVCLKPASTDPAAPTYAQVGVRYVTYHKSEDGTPHRKQATRWVAVRSPVLGVVPLHPFDNVDATFVNTMVVAIEEEQKKGKLPDLSTDLTMFEQPAHSNPAPFHT